MYTNNYSKLTESISVMSEKEMPSTIMSKLNN